MPRYLVHGASAATGKDTSIEVRAESQQDAESIALGRGMLISGVERLGQGARIETTTLNIPALVCGIIATILGVVALTFAWIPLVGLFAVPLAVIGTLLALVGCVLALAKRGRGVAMPLLGLFLCASAAGLAILMTAGAAGAIEKATQEMEAARAQRRSSLTPAGGS